MNWQIEDNKATIDFRMQSTFAVAIAASILLTPFAINNFYQNRLLLGIGSMVIVAILALNAFIIKNGKHYPSLTFVVLVPTLILFLCVAYSNLGIVAALWCYPTILAFYCMLPERKAWMANLALLFFTMPQAWEVLEFTLTIRVFVTLLAVSVFSAIFVRVITSQQNRFETEVVTDSLTGLLNRVLLRETLEQAVSQHRHTGTPMTLLALDLDSFKATNDTLGHDAGDTVLRGVGELLKNHGRRSDTVFRLGGEEFLVLLFGTNSADGLRIAEELRAEIETTTFLHEHVVTSSIGHATLQPGEDWTAWSKRSDKNLYAAKASGRNRVVG